MWRVLEHDGRWLVATEDYVHPIPFESRREAMRAVTRLNDRDKPDPVPHAHLDEH